MKKLANKKGFTLIEMLVVIAIIAILVAIVIPTITNATEKAKEAADAANIRSLAAEAEIEYLAQTGTPKAVEKTYALTQTGDWEHITDVCGVKASALPKTGTVYITVSAAGKVAISNASGLGE